MFRARTADRTWVWIWPRVVLERGSWVLEVREVHGALPRSVSDDASSASWMASLQGWTARLHLAGFSVSVVGGRQEILHAAIGGIALGCEVGQKELSASLSVRELQMDNSLPNPVYPAVVQMEQSQDPVLSAKLQVAFPSGTVSMVNCLEVNAQPLRVNLDKAFLSHLLLALEEDLFTRDQPQAARAAASAEPNFTSFSLRSPQVFVRELFFDRLEVTLSYSPASQGLPSKNSALHVALFEGLRLDYLPAALQLKVVIGELKLVNFQAPRSELLERVVGHLQQECMAQWAAMLYQLAGNIAAWGFQLGAKWFLKDPVQLRQRLRLPRYFDVSGALQPYAGSEAGGAALLSAVEDMVARAQQVLHLTPHRNHA
jgi:hypothetical protein